MPYVSRKDGAVSGLFLNPQEGYAEEWLDEDDAEVVAFRSPVPGAPDLLPYQFRAMLELSGYKDDLDAYVDGLEGLEKIVARAKLDSALSFRRDNELVEAARVAIGISTEDLDALWLQAAAL